MTLICEQLRCGLIGVPEALRRAADRAYPEYPNLEYILRRGADAFEGQEDKASAEATRADSAEEILNDSKLKHTAALKKLS